MQKDPSPQGGTDAESPHASAAAAAEEEEEEEEEREEEEEAQSSPMNAQAVARASPTPGTSPLAADEGGKLGGGARWGGGEDGLFPSSSFGPLPASSFPSLPSFPKEKSVSGASAVKNPWGRKEGSPRPGSLRPHAR